MKATPRSVRRTRRAMVASSFAAFALVVAGCGTSDSGGDDGDADAG